MNIASVLARRFTRTVSKTLPSPTKVTPSARPTEALGGLQRADDVRYAASVRRSAVRCTDSVSRCHSLPEVSQRACMPRAKKENGPVDVRDPIETGEGRQSDEEIDFRFSEPSSPRLRSKGAKQMRVPCRRHGLFPPDRGICHRERVPSRPVLLACVFP